MTQPGFLVGPGALSGERVVLTGTELRHLRVRRLRVGNQLILSDGQGTQRLGTLVAVDRHRALVQLQAIEEPGRESPLRLVLAQAALKADKMDLVIEKATELGVSEVQVFTSQRSLARPSDARRARWERIARSAAKQCRRSTIPLLNTPVALGMVLSRTEALRILFWEGRDPQLTAGIGTAGHHPSEALVVVGPEGGFSAAETAHAAAQGFLLCTLGPRVLRAETAALAAVALCQFLWGDLR